MKITRLEIENTKRIRAVTLEPAENGLTVIGGRNGQGKTSVLDAIAWALGGEKYRPSSPTREGSVIPPRLRVTMDNGLIVERSGEKSALKVIDPEGRRGGQQLLNEFIEQLALDLPKFMQASAKEKASVLLRIIGVEDELNALNVKEGQAYNRRTEIGRIAAQKQKYADELPFYPDTPAEPISASELILRQQKILAKNGENAKLRERAAKLREEYEEAEKRLAVLTEQLAIAEKSAADLIDESTEEIRESLLNIEAINTKVRANSERQRAECEAEGYRKEYDALTSEIDGLRDAKKKLLDGADLPLAGLSVSDGELTYNGAKWDCMSGAEQLRVAAAIVRRLNPKCGFVLIDKLEQMDSETMRDFGAWLESEGLQAIATRVGTDGECAIIIEDGVSVVPENQQKLSTGLWKAGEF